MNPLPGASFLQEAGRASWQRQYRFDSSYEGTFFFQGRSGMVGSSYAPHIQPEVLFFDADLAAQGLLIVGNTQRRKFILIGAVTAHRSLTYFTLHVRQKCFESLTVVQPEIEFEAVGEELCVLEGDDWRQLLIEYAEKVRARAGLSAQAFDSAPNAIGFCSWYYSFHHLSEVELFENADALERHRASFPATFAQIDDGYQAHHGDWLLNNSRWPSAMADVVARLRDRGLTAGIWTMPLLASTASDVFRSHPDWFVRDEEGRDLIIPGWSPPPEDRWVCLDASYPEVEEHLRRVYTSLYDAGFRYFKLDGVGLSYPVGQRYRKDATGISSLRNALRIIRESVKSSVILNCGAPFLAALGWVDHSRVSTDTGIRWKSAGIPTDGVLREVEDWELQDPTIPCLINALQQSLDYWWAYDRWFRADPDVVIVRDERTCLSMGEARMSVLTGIMTGCLITSDRLDRMSQERIELLGHAAELRVSDIRPLEISPAGPPEIYSGKVDGRSAVAIFNWSRQPKTWSLEKLGLASPSKDALRNLGVERETVVPPHDAALLIGD